MKVEMFHPKLLDIVKDVLTIAVPLSLLIYGIARRTRRHLEVHDIQLQKLKDNSFSMEARLQRLEDTTLKKLEHVDRRMSALERGGVSLSARFNTAMETVAKREDVGRLSDNVQNLIKMIGEKK